MPVYCFLTTFVFQAESELSDKDKREELDALMKQARYRVLKSLDLPVSTESDDPALKGLNPPFKARLKTQSKELLIEEELRRRKYVRRCYIPIVSHRPSEPSSLTWPMKAWKPARRKKRLLARSVRRRTTSFGKVCYAFKTLATSANMLAENREERVGSWRNFAATSGKKKKKTKVAILG